MLFRSLPVSAMIITYAGPAGRQAVMADANPGIGGLGAATQLTLEEFHGGPIPRAPGASAAEAVREPAGDHDAAPDSVSWRSGPGRPPPNLGPPPPRLDWRKRRS